MDLYLVAIISMFASVFVVAIIQFLQTKYLAVQADKKIEKLAGMLKKVESHISSDNWKVFDNDFKLFRSKLKDSIFSLQLNVEYLGFIENELEDYINQIQTGNKVSPIFSNL